ncbi:hypothetical protein Slin15195_G075090 [Septoria linicola]|uniref:Uncharacterized protein n=1 Tax=Septoria linicola TaxID=215465 RepID=A0A9Q9AXB9_9PEZI|nr:hypothetical protein Slin15195_G075090 [Septoria linicola]
MATPSPSRITPDDINIPAEAPLTPTSKAFPFFRLPRELRDAIYKGIEERQGTFNKAGRHAIMATIDELPTEACLLVSQQFQAEYLYTVRERAYLQVQNCGKLSKDFRLPATIGSVRRCGVVIYVGDSSDARQHLTWLQRTISGLSESCKLHVKLVLKPGLVSDVVPFLQSLASLRALTAIQIYRDAHPNDWVRLNEANLSFRQDPMGSWTIEEGWCSAAVTVFGSELCKASQPSVGTTSVEV